MVIWPKNPYQISGISVTPHPSHIPIRIESNDHCAYWPSCLHAYPILAIIHISHHAHQPSCQSTIMTPNPLILILSYHAYQPSYLSAIIPISFIVFRPSVCKWVTKTPQPLIIMPISHYLPSISYQSYRISAIIPFNLPPLSLSDIGYITNVH